MIKKKKKTRKKKRRRREGSSWFQVTTMVHLVQDGVHINQATMGLAGEHLIGTSKYERETLLVHSIITIG